jgi:predicted aspartyl protease
MPMRLARLLACLTPVLLTACAAGGAGQGVADACHVEKRAELPLQVVPNNRLLVPATIDGKPVVLQLDTGGQRTLLSRAAAGRLGLTPDPRRATAIQGIGGTVERRNVLFRSFDLGDIRAGDWDQSGSRSLGVADLSMPTADGQPVDGLLGADVLSEFDIDLDVPDRTVAFYTVRGCGRNFAPSWPGVFAGLDAARTPRGGLLLPVGADGKVLAAVLDTGAGLSLVSAAGARSVGVTQDGLTPAGPVSIKGVDGTRVPVLVHRFSELQIGPEIVRNQVMPVADVNLDGAQMLIGADFLRTHRIWLSYATSRIFLQPRRPGVLPAR